MNLCGLSPLQPQVSVLNSRNKPHVIMDVPTYPETLFITWMLRSMSYPLPRRQTRYCIKTRSNCSHRSGLATHVLRFSPRSKRSRLRYHRRSTRLPSARWPTAGKSLEPILDGPLAFDNAIDPEAARIKGIHSPVAGRARIPGRAGSRGRTQHCWQKISSTCGK